MMLDGRPNSRVLGVLTFNMEHRDNPANLALMADHLRTDLREVPSFVLCQEVVFNRSAHQNEDNTAAVLADQLGYFSRGTKRTSDHEGVAILSKYPFDFYASHELESQTTRFLFGFNRVSVMGEFLVPEIGRVRVANVQLTNWGFEHRVRANQLRETLEWINQRESQVHADVTILGGDFNIEPSFEERSMITDRSITGDLIYHDYNTTDPTRGPHGHPTVRVDYVFVASAHSDVRFLDEQRLFTHGILTGKGNQRVYLSDHTPMLHEYMVRAPVMTAAAKPARAKIISTAAVSQ